MLEETKKVLVNQYEAGLCLLESCLIHCPDELWNEPVAKLKYCQVAFHTLFFTDLYLGHDVEAVSSQEFHRNHQSQFADYEELQPRFQHLLYEKEFLEDYLLHCLYKARKEVPKETTGSLFSPCEFEWKNLNRLELHFSNIRHIQHHVAQLGMRLRLSASIELPWISAGWHD